MKKTPLLLLPLPLLLGIIFIVYSCNTKEKECVSCKQENAVLRKQLKIEINSQNFDIEDVPIWIKPAYENLNYGDQRLNAEQFDAISKTIDESNKPEVLIFYFNKDLINNSHFTIKDIKGISTFKIDDKMLIHSFYRNENAHFEKDPYLSIHTSFLSISPILQINQQILKSTSSSILLIDKAPSRDFKPSNKIDLLKKLVNHYYSIKIAASKKLEALYRKGINSKNETLEDVLLLLTTQYSEESGNCGGWCWESSPGFCIRDLKQVYPASYKCMDNPKGNGLCKATETQYDLQKANATDNTSINTAFDTSLHYYIKNNLLSSNELGLKYRNYYYYFSDIYSEEHDLSLALQVMQALIHLNKQLEKLKDISGQYDSDIFLNEELFNEISGIINQYRAIYNDYYTELLMRDFTSDMQNLMLNKRIVDVRSLFN